MSKSKGYIKLYRDILSHWVYDDEILFRAWVHLLLTANHSDNKVMFDGELITIHTGEMLTSLRKLSESWKCGYKKTRNIIDILEREHMITRKSAKKGTQKGTLLTIVNYEIYQSLGHTEESTEESTEETQTINDKEFTKNDKERGKRKKPPTLTDIKEYCSLKNKNMTELAQKKFYTWLLSEKGKYYLPVWEDRLDIWNEEDEQRESEKPKNIDYEQRNVEVDELALLRKSGLIS